METTVTDLFERAASGEEVRVDYTAIERTLADMWRADGVDEQHTVTRAALWNVVAHTLTPQHHAYASETLSKAAAAVPQRTIIVRADPDAEAELSSWISANCHIGGDGKRVCSEEIAIVAGGTRVTRVPPLVNALLIPDMPVALWWVGDLPHENAEYVHTLLDPADRLIVDSVHFNDPADLAIVKRVADDTGTAPADLNWIRLEEWRTATASVFDPPEMRDKLRTLKRVQIAANVQDETYFGERIESLFFASWLMAQSGAEIDVTFDLRRSDRRGLIRVELELADSKATIERDHDRCVLSTNIDGRISVPDAVTRSQLKNIDELIVRVLKQPGSDRLLPKILPVTLQLAQQMK
ncbi:MAG TPA: glucose-6-phosphate dehydrogenase assembly protein OpcA [Thermoanaerobaculia bacterium]|nr:glucose-6-phosphate dehydrogenase assembly protein OpcA [Thermoanaerobaculia bacterium]